MKQNKQQKNTMKNKNDVGVTTTVSLVTSKTKLEQKQVELDKALTEALAEKTRLEQEMKDKINALPVQFGVKTIDEFLNLVNMVLGRGGKRARVSKETKTKIIAELKAGNKPVKLIAVENNVSTGTVNLLKKTAGLTKPRDRK